ncbi:helix-turn-helix domain-containing protein [Arthrobacter humicola]|uniref:helix-turn-helix domain-containing protein n=1 Tax=Arthrobacter humicola TaxID=409291 RepID=UPI0027E0CB31|nr:helix-turn-helix transcriptional regulator [Arthrobacter humicola]
MRGVSISRGTRSAHSIGAVHILQDKAPESPTECGPTPSEIAAMVRLNRENAGLTQHQLATRMGSTQSIVARWESGEHEITMANLTRIADALGVVFVVRFGAKGSKK